MDSPSLSSSEDTTPTLESSDDIFEQSDENGNDPELPLIHLRLPAGRRHRKQRREVTQAIVFSILVQINRPNKPSIREVAASVDLEVSTARKLLKTIREGVYDYGDNTVFIPTQKGRKSSTQTCQFCTNL